jgi:hypothetical protein
MLIWKFFDWKACHKCGSVMTMIFIRKEVGWGQNHDLASGIYVINYKIKICGHCGDRFTKQIRLTEPTMNDIRKYIEAELECLR